MNYGCLIIMLALEKIEKDLIIFPYTLIIVMGKKSNRTEVYTEDLYNWVFIFSNFLSFLICKMRLDYKSSKLLLSSNIPWLNWDLQLNLQKD